MVTNQVILVGNLGQEVQIRYTQTEKAVCRLRMATNERFTRQDGERGERTEWHTVVAWGRLAEMASDLKKGARVYVEGRLQTRQWEDQKGVTRYSTEVVANAILPVAGSKRQAEPPKEPPVDDDDIPY